MSRIFEAGAGAIGAVIGWRLSRWAGLGIAPSLLIAWAGDYLVSFVAYEWILEPLGTIKNPIFRTGYYHERGPRDGETFTRW